MIGAAVESGAFLKALTQYAADLEKASGEAIAVALQGAKALGIYQVGQVTKRRTGGLQDGWQTVQISSTRGKLFNLAPYGQWVNDGTRPHVIRARNAKFLRFTVGGVVMFRRSVMHPGTKPRKFVQSIEGAGEMLLARAATERVERLNRAFSR